MTAEILDRQKGHARRLPRYGTYSISTK